MSAENEIPQDYPGCLRFLYARNQFAIKLGLENINALLDRLGRPDAAAPGEPGRIFLHVAGTNGKGSVCANLAALLEAAGFRRVGLYTSPHLVSFRERIRVDGEPISKEWIVDWMRRRVPLLLELKSTYFECVTAMALDYFRDRDCGAVVLETGLGGRLDATNAVRPALTVVTSVSLDHTSILGDTVEEIWGEKIAIMKPGVPMVVRESRPHLLRMLTHLAEELGSPVHIQGDYPLLRDGGGGLRFRGRYGDCLLPGDLRDEEHQVENLALSLLALETFLDGPLPPAEALAPALRGARLPGRTQLLEGAGMRPVLLDGAHNPEGMQALAAHLRRKFPGRRINALFAVMRDKDVASVARAVLGFASEVLFVPLEGKFPRALAFAEMEAALSPQERHSFRLFPLEGGALEAALRAGGGGEMTVVCGSLYLLGEVIPLLRPHYPGLAWFDQFQGES